MITSLKQNEIFVFGSNLAGIHGAGAALMARNIFGAQLGVGEGRTGQTYALPTKDEHIKTLSLDEIRKHVEKFIAYAQANPDLVFLITPVGCGLAGYTPKDIAPLFECSPSNVVLPAEFMTILLLHKTNDMNVIQLDSLVTRVNYFSKSISTK